MSTHKQKQGGNEMQRGDEDMETEAEKDDEIKRG